jgi:hypothetical protein
MQSTASTRGCHRCRRTATGEGAGLPPMEAWGRGPAASPVAPGRQQRSGVGLGLQHLAAAVEAGRADVVAQVHFTGGGLDAVPGAAGRCANGACRAWTATSCFAGRPWGFSWELHAKGRIGLWAARPTIGRWCRCKAFQYSTGVVVRVSSALGRGRSAARAANGCSAGSASALRRLVPAAPAGVAGSCRAAAPAAGPAAVRLPAARAGRATCASTSTSSSISASSASAAASSRARRGNGGPVPATCSLGCRQRWQTSDRTGAPAGAARVRPRRRHRHPVPRPAPPTDTGQGVSSAPGACRSARRSKPASGHWPCSCALASLANAFTSSDGDRTARAFMQAV